MRSHTTNLRVAWIDTDASKRIHYTAALRWFETAEHDLMREVYRELGRSAPAILPRVHVEADYQAALLYDMPIACTATVEAVGASSITYGYRVVTEDGRVAVTGKIIAVLLDQDGRPAAIDDQFRAALEQ